MASVPWQRHVLQQKSNERGQSTGSEKVGSVAMHRGGQCCCPVSYAHGLPGLPSGWWGA